jgi:hypothetical protein
MGLIRIEAGGVWLNDFAVFEEKKADLAGRHLCYEGFGFVEGSTDLRQYFVWVERLLS